MLDKNFILAIKILNKKNRLLDLPRYITWIGKGQKINKVG